MQKEEPTPAPPAPTTPIKTSEYASYATSPLSYIFAFLVLAVPVGGCVYFVGTKRLRQTLGVPPRSARGPGSEGYARLATLEQ